MAQDDTNDDSKRVRLTDLNVPIYSSNSDEAAFAFTLYSNPDDARELAEMRTRELTDPDYDPNMERDLRRLISDIQNYIFARDNSLYSDHTPVGSEPDKSPEGAAIAAQKRAEYKEKLASLGEILAEDLRKLSVRLEEKL